MREASLHSLCEGRWKFRTKKNAKLTARVPWFHLAVHSDSEDTVQFFLRQTVLPLSK